MGLFNRNQGYNYERRESERTRAKESQKHWKKQYEQMQPVREIKEAVQKAQHVISKENPDPLPGINDTLQNLIIGPIIEAIKWHNGENIDANIRYQGSRIKVSLTHILPEIGSVHTDFTLPKSGEWRDYHRQQYSVDEVTRAIESFGIKVRNGNERELDSIDSYSRFMHNFRNSRSMRERDSYHRTFF